MRQYIDIDGVRVAYDIDGEGPPMLFLHGWGGSAKSFLPVYQTFAQWFRVIAIDFPGFGESSLPAETWGVGEYAECVYHFLQALAIDKTHVIGHSFGGRVAIWLAAHHPEVVDKMTLVDAAGIRPRRSWKYYVKVYTFKTCKRLYNLGLLGPRRPERLERLYRLFGSADYREAGPLRNIMVRVVNQDLTPLLPNIKASTLLIWGEHDEATPVWFGKTMERLIPDAGLVVLPNAGHYSYLDQLGSFNKIVKHFYLGSA
ncbi:alpha/beta hydrolase [Alicyclobacillus cellulosilyticus]|uniref:Alpha/beta hydrolase n=1 Tax=Alicyclobacillus cellulosilyticus TaxID=1003997 RepID=A0A917K169_9BACL|nr:alpha/beta hydrolase [Alicyclobacillus cellulosilyticus]GGI95774.1 alpha/beta hydrolase [Alicyclobacillus cellulosilyticus]